MAEFYVTVLKQTNIYRPGEREEVYVEADYLDNEVGDLMFLSHNPKPPSAAGLLVQSFARGEWFRVRRVGTK